MKQPLLHVCFLLAVFLSANVLAQNPVQIQFQTDPVLTQTGTDSLFTVVTTTSIFSMTWKYNGLDTLGSWSGGTSNINPVTQFLGRVTITSNQLRIGSTQLRDAGNYSVEVTPVGTTGQTSNSRSVQLRVFEAVAGVTLSIPSVTVEGGNVTLTCAWTAGTEISVQWAKGGLTITADSRITISGGSLVINPVNRDDAGEYKCTASNPVSAQTATRSLTVYYGPDTPVLTKDTSKNCVGGGDVLVGKAVRLTCTSVSLPPAIFSWEFNGNPISGQPDGGVLTIQTYSTNESGKYACTAKNSITGGTSKQTTSLAVVDVCLDGGEVAGIVIGSFLLLVIIVLLIVLLICLVRRKRVQQRQRDNIFIPKTETNQRPNPPATQPNARGDLEPGPEPPIYPGNGQTRRSVPLNTIQRENNAQTLTVNRRQNYDTLLHNGRTLTNGLLHNGIQRTNSNPHNGIDNPAFTHTEALNANNLPNTQQPNPNVVIQAGNNQGGQPPAVQVSFNTLPRTTEPNAQMPTINLNLNSYPPNNQQIQPESFVPAINPADTMQQNLLNTRQSNPTIPHHLYPGDPGLNGHVNRNLDNPGLIPTGYTHFNSNVAPQQDANTQTNQQELHRTARVQEATPSSTRRQMPWDRLRGTPAYPNGTQASPEYPSDTTDYTRNRDTQEVRAPVRAPVRSQPPNQTVSRRRTPPRRDPPLYDTESSSRTTDHRHPNARITQLEPSHRSERSPRAQSHSTERDIRGSQTALRQEMTRSSNPQALSLTSQLASAGRAGVSQAPTAEQVQALQGVDTRALVDPNHFRQAQVGQQRIEAPVQATLNHGSQPQPARNVARQPQQGGLAPAPNSSAQPNPSSLTQAALKVHTERAQAFQSRRQQTQATLLSNRQPQTQTPATGAQHPPTPPPVIPLVDFQTLPKERTQHRSPARGPLPVRHTGQQPWSGRPGQPTAVAANRHHHHGNGHMHVGAQRQGHGHAQGHGRPAHVTHTRQQQAHRGRPRR
ncbi:uncharacterized protein LOC105356000 isoform X1 [Oryzias latipes]|uniref:Si:dkeyp-97a10.3 n=2 Tax=Oryzias latipes TaxID=8090 RepID=A0A3B3IFH9_ORYLA|nr:uncharacterized protein LOC105356000 isoform X1 [Oryzias latipes]